MTNEKWKFVQAKSKQAIKQVPGIRNETARMKVTPPLAVAGGTWHHLHIRRKMTCDGTAERPQTTTALTSTRKGATRPITAARARPQHKKISNKQQVIFYRRVTCNF